MERQEYDELLRTSAAIQVELKRTDISEAQRQDLAKHQMAIAGALMSIWLPMSMARRITMLIIFLAGLVGAFSGLPQLLIIWAAIPLFSPRCMGEAAYLLGAISRGR